MDWSLLLLLLALAATWVLWRRARAQTTAARAAAAQAVQINTFELEPFEEADVRGFHIVDASGARMDADRLNWLEQGLDVLDVDEPLLAPGAGGGEFAPGAEVELIPDETPADAPESISVWNPTMTLRCGAVRANQAPALIWRLDHEEVGSCVVLSETRTGGRAVHLRLLLVHRDVDVGIAPQE